MPESQTKEEEYLIPVNVSSGFELVEGFGFSEIMTTACVVVAGIILVFAAQLFLSIPLHFSILIFVIAPSSFVFFLVKRGNNSPSVLSLLISILDFGKSQKRYLFKLKN